MAGGVRFGFDVGVGVVFSTGGGVLSVAVGVTGVAVGGLVAVGGTSVGTGIFVGNDVAAGTEFWRTFKPALSDPGAPLAVKVT